MIDPNDPLEVQVEKQAKIIEALIKRSNRGHDIGGSVYSLFQSAIALQGEVWEKTKDLQHALDTLGQASNQLEIAEYAREQTQRNLAYALDAMEGGFALFTDGSLEICNDQFKSLIEDVADLVKPGLQIDDYFSVIAKSPEVTDSAEIEPYLARLSDLHRKGSTDAPIVLGLMNDRWFQITHKQTSPDKIVLLQTEITSIVRHNRIEHDRLIDEQAHFLQAAFDHMNQGVSTFSSEGTLLFQNQRFRDLLRLPYLLRRKGTSFGQIVDFVKKNERLYEVSTPGEFGQWAEKVRSGAVLTRKLRHVSGDMLDIHVHPLPDGGFIMNVMDITVESQTKEGLEKRVRERTVELTDANRRLRLQYDEQAKVEEQLRLAKEEAEAAVSLKTRFFAAASHDLLQPVNAAKLLISTMLETSRHTGLADTAERLDRSFTSIESLLHALLDISRLDSTGTEMSITTIAIDDILQSVKEDYSQLAAEKGLSLDVVSSSLCVRSDQRYLLRSVQNLVVNAIQYTGSGRILAGCRRRDGRVVLEVWDTGIGISDGEKKNIFAEFTRGGAGHSSFGMGLGLSIVERACRRLGHQISVRSTPGVGSVFSITLPQDKPANVLPGSKRSELNVPHADLDLIVIVVEDNPEVLFATTQKVESWGGSVLGAASTAEAVALVREIGMAPDIILADYQLEGEDNGIQSIIALRTETGSDIPAIMITADRADSLTQASHKHRFTVLTKPVQLSRLRSLIDWKTRKSVAS